MTGKSATFRCACWLLACLTFALLGVSTRAAAETIRVAASGDLQAALVAAKPGDTIELAVAKFVGNFSLPSKTGVVTLRTAGTLPDRRITPADASLVATLASPNSMPAISCEGCENWALIGLRFEPNVGGFSDVISLQRFVNVSLDRLLLEVPDGLQQKNGVVANGRTFALTRSWLAGLRREGQESHALVFWDGAGPYVIRDNYLEAASINILIGGADATSAETVPSDITVEGNHLFKRPAWKGQEWVVKNLLELKAARRVTIRKNLLENVWSQAQSGHAFVITPVNQNGSAPWSGVEYVLIEQNILRGAERGFAITGYGSKYPAGSPAPGGSTRQTTHITIRDNTIEVSERAFWLANEIGTAAIYRNAITMPSDHPVLSLDKTVVWPTGEAERPAQYAVGHLTYAENPAPGTYIHSSQVVGDGAFKAYTNTYSLTVDGAPAPPPTPDPDTTTPDPLVELQARLNAVEARALLAEQRHDALVAYLAKLPQGLKLLGLIQYLQRVPK